MHLLNLLPPPLAFAAPFSAIMIIGALALVEVTAGIYRGAIEGLLVSMPLPVKSRRSDLASQWQAARARVGGLRADEKRVLSRLNGDF